MNEEMYDIVVIGAGPGGYHAAIRAAQYDAKVMLIEKDKVGGTCLNRGCISTKALYSSASLIEKIKNHAFNYGIDINGEVKPNFNRAVDRKNRIVNQLIENIEVLIRQKKVDLSYGSGKLMGGSIENAFNVKIEGKDEKIVKAKRLIIATGSKPAEIPSFNINHERILTSDDILSNNFKSIPNTILIIGGGVIGCEFANIFNRFGSKVIILEYLPSIIAMEEPSVARELKKKFRDMGIEVFEDRRVLEITTTDSQVNAITCDANIPKDQVESAEKRVFNADLCLVSIGRIRCIKNLGIENSKIEIRRGSIQVNEKTLETAEKGIYAIGDVTGGLMLAHVASYEADIAVFNALSSIGGFDTFPVKTDYKVVPSSIFTAYEIASVGFKSKSLKVQDVQIRTGRFGYAGLGKAKCMGEEEGFLMMNVNEKTDEILGASCIGVAAPELISEISLAMKNGLTVQEITDTIHSHPTLSEMVLEAAEDVYGLSIHRARRRIKQKIDLQEDMIQHFIKSEKLKKYGLVSLAMTGD